MINVLDIPKNTLAGLVSLFRRGNPESKHAGDDWPEITDGVRDQLAYRIAQGYVRQKAPQTYRVEHLDHEVRLRDG